ncbi:Peroxidase 29-like protein [Drosera capensis]
MDTKITTLLIVLLPMSLMVLCCVEAQLAYNFYDDSCPNVESIVRTQMLPMLATDPTASAAFLRMLFHDCQVQGCDASILLDTENAEIAARRNFGIRKREEIGQIKSTLELLCPGQVSCADIIAMAARESVAFAGGPRFQIPLGRKDSTTSSHRQADIHLPSPRIGVDQLSNIFTSKGMELDESVAILGAHTLGTGHCINIVDRLYNPGPMDTMDLTYELFLKLQCPTKVPITNLTSVPNDSTPTLFDNQYFKDISLGKSLFGVDSSLALDPRTGPIVEQFAADPEHFFRAFSSAFVKLSSANVLTGSSGEVRLRCNQVN